MQICFKLTYTLVIYFQYQIIISHPQKLNTHNATISLIMENVTFDEFHFHHYCSNCLFELDIRALIIADCKIIQTDHGTTNMLKYFDQIGLGAMLDYFSVQNMILDSMLYNPFLLASLNFQNTIFLDLQKDYFDKLRNFLNRLSIEFVPEYLNIDLIFNSRENWQWHIEALSLRSQHDQMRTIARNNFTYLKRLSFLDLSNCKIDNIFNGAFDHILNTLETLILNSNHIKMPVYVIHRLIDKMNISLALKIHLLDNEIECNCKIMELWDVIKVNQIQTPSFFVDMPCRTSENRSHCQPSQLIGGTSRCFPSSVSHSYPKFSIKFSDDQERILINGPGHLKYRLFVQSFIDEDFFNSKWGYSLFKCPRAGFIERYVKCLTLDLANETIPVSYFGGANMTRIICINYVIAGPKRFWPLHCIPHQLVLDDDDKLKPFVSVKMYLLFLLAGSSLMFFGGCILVFL